MRLLARDYLHAQLQGPCLLSPTLCMEIGWRSICRFAVVPLCLLLAACPWQTEITVAPGSSADHLTFRVRSGGWIPRPISIGFLRVDACAVLYETPGISPPQDRAAWVLEARIGEATRLSEIHYGSVPEGYSETRPATPLQMPGCYVATISGTGVTAFTINESGRIVEMCEEERLQRQL